MTKQTNDSLALINLSIAQIRGILTDGSDSMTELTDSFVHVAGLVENMRGKTDEDSSLGHELGHIHEKICQGIMAFQFFDRISQRLEHVSHTLSQVEAAEKLSGPDFELLLKQCRNQLTIESERVLFDRIIAGDSIEDAFTTYLNFEKEEKSKHDDIELF